MDHKFILYFAAAVTTMTAVVFFFLFKAANTPENTDKARGVITVPDTGKSTESELFLYFSDREKNHLAIEQRVFTTPDDPVALGRAIIEALIQGPRNGLLRTIPTETSLRALYIKDKTAYADFSMEILDRHPGGSLSEYMTIYSIVNSLIVNIPAIESVKILIGGEEVDTLAGHISIRSPLKADMLLVR